MKLFKKNLVTSFLSLGLCGPGLMAQQPYNEWQESKTSMGNFKPVSSLPDIEVFSAPNTILVKVNQPTEVRIFSILGKLISSQRLEPGLFEYHIDSHGIYIIKTNDNSCKLAI
ncbi:MAG: hypothetical protein J1F16_06345 [Muribaculaceae bacterium]|nr:hypothetical protein [Muribaculaceae bacterium]